MMAVLEAVVNGNGRWCATVASECDAGSQKPGLEAMAQARAIFGEPLYPDAAEHVDIQVLRDQMRQPGDRSTAHLGEAETITIITSRNLTGAFVTDDKGAQRQAKSNGIHVYNTWHILKLAVGAGMLSVEEFNVAYRTLVDAERGHPPCASDATSVSDWLLGKRQ